MYYLAPIYWRFLKNISFPCCNYDLEVAIGSSLPTKIIVVPNPYYVVIVYSINYVLIILVYCFVVGTES